MTAKHLLDQIERGLDGEAREYLIKKGPYFYRKDKSGYTEFKFDAGRYTKEDAEREAEIEPWHMKAIHQDDVPDKTDPDKFIRELEARATAAEATVTALKVACPCTTFEQDEDCQVGYPSMLCGICKGTGNTTPDKITALACEMVKIASDVGEPEDPFAAWETVDLIKSQNVQLSAALEQIADLTARCEHDGGFDRETGPIGCNLGDKCLCIGLHPIARAALSQIRSEK